jgi:hypothetical protein
VVVVFVDAGPLKYVIGVESEETRALCWYAWPGLWAKRTLDARPRSAHTAGRRPAHSSQPLAASAQFLAPSAPRQHPLAHRALDSGLSFRGPHSPV